MLYFFNSVMYVRSYLVKSAMCESVMLCYVVMGLGRFVLSRSRLKLSRRSVADLGTGSKTL